MKGEKTKELWKNPEYRMRMSEAHKGRIPTNMEKLIAFTKSPEGREFHRSYMTGNRNYAYKGEEAVKFRKGYHGVHKWVRKVMGAPKYCMLCKETEKRKYEWANVSGEYKRDIADWLRLCSSCHKLFDIGKIKI